LALILFNGVLCRRKPLDNGKSVLGYKRNAIKFFVFIYATFFTRVATSNVFYPCEKEPFRLSSVKKIRLKIFDFTCIKTGTRHGANRLTFGKKYDITNSPTNKTLKATFKMINKLGGELYD